MEISSDKLKIVDKLRPGIGVIIEGEAGTGKTLTGVLCGQKLLGSTKSWQNILYLTFSKLAKRQISECIHKLLDKGILEHDVAKRMKVMNYHSLWWQLLSKHYSFLGISREPLLCTSSETEALARKAMSAIRADKIAAVFVRKDGKLDQRKKKTLIRALSGSAAVYAQWGAENFGRHASDFVGAQDFLQWINSQIFGWNRTGLFSHAETVCWAHRLLKNHPNELASIRERFPVLIIDEFQDTDIAQWDVVQLLAPKTLVILADGAQTIHIWRGADPNRLGQLKTFCQNAPGYELLGTQRLSTRHRAPKPMSVPENITWRELKLRKNPSSHYQEMNAYKLKAKTACKNIAIRGMADGKSVGILCLTNEIANDITSFLRSRQDFLNKGFLLPIPCIRLGADNSPFESARSLILQLLDRVVQHEMQSYLANTLLQLLLPCRIKDCSARSRKLDLKNRWEQAGIVAQSLRREFGTGLREIARYVTDEARSRHCYGDKGLIGCLRHVGTIISRTGVKAWESSSPEEKRRRIDAAVLQYENAFASSQTEIAVNVMTVHQSKSRQFSIVVIPWFTEIPWSTKELGWDTSNTEHQNLFHTACTRAEDKAIVIFPKGQMAVWPASR